MDSGAVAADEAGIGGEQKRGEGGDDGEGAIGEAEGEDDERGEQEKVKRDGMQEGVDDGGGKEGQNADGLEQFARELGEAPEGIKAELDDPEHEDAEARETQQARPGLFMDEPYWPDEIS